MGASAAPPDSWRVWTARAPSLGPALGLVDLPTGRAIIPSAYAVAVVWLETTGKEE